MKYRLVPLLLLLAFGPALAGEQTQVRRAVAEGRLRPLTDILAEVQARHPGRVVDVELERMRDGGYVYEVQILTPDRQKVEIRVDGASGRILSPGHASARPQLPLPELLRTAQLHYSGRVVDVELDQDRYRIELLQAGGRRINVLVDPVTGEMQEEGDRAIELAEVQPMADVIEAVLRDYPGILVDGELERTDDGRYRYELEISDANGRERSLLVDAVSGEVLREEAD